ncbi:chymotrypsin-2-like isoform X2 [Bradysia coprophila]|uniref:chymotrypsin-2-like isoform X2 n=1 Tax=Bradysia coprophila TaxID=38358 RepID=UPI00187DD3B6|nr:chymotrypsin-2-like isoform X2 [Bradysia coprophila]
MKLKLFVVYCLLQSIHGFDNSEELFTKKLNISTDDPFKSAVLYIVGGHNASIHPFQCSIQSNRKHYCGCAVINSKFVLTATHCFEDHSPESSTILVGTNDLNRGGMRYEIEKLIPYEDTEENPNDIALVKVKVPIQFNENVLPIELDDKEVPDNAVVQLTGWGRMQARGTTPNKLQGVDLTVLAFDECKKTVVGDVLIDGHMCTKGVMGIGACKGDSGGPLTYGKKLVGIVSFGIPCGIGNPDVYSKVSYYFDWIKKNSQT